MEPVTPTEIALKLLRRFWPAIPIVGLAVALWFSREDAKAAKANEAAAVEHVATVEKANEQLAGALDTIKQQRVDNDAIAAAVAARLGANTIRETNTKTIIEKAVSNDPKVRDWAGAPIPDSVREALRAH
jgi:hypothetical protein